MADDLLAKEKEYHRLNKELQLKTKNIIEEVDSVINSQKDIRSLITTEALQSKICHASNNYYTDPPRLIDFDREFIKPQVNNNDPDDILVANNKTQKNNDAVIKILKTKIQTLYSDNEKIKDELKKKTNYCIELENENTKIRDIKDKYSLQISNNKNQITKLEENNIKIQTELQSSTKENLSLKKELDLLKKEIKMINQQTNNTEMRLNRSLEETEKWKNTYKTCKIEEKNLREKIKSLQDDERVVIKNLEKQKTELLQAFKKQMFLVDNLKKQKALLESTKQIQLTRQDMSKIINWKNEINGNT
ncbi:hypothetical protein HCN44_002048 [Aphidius gifuensis]|uniref:Uncharacterized protein n=1 Tax=Aphidius gifuensis TaxID=684658 RepID=A0A834Y0M3_APHGI|nr:testis-expressed protein 9 [Aphidius gifuensis]KAF7996416.1 hypothetical protein HCN44_002048 [Aphidius gifuensis]